jgi:hypothetical protein
VVYPSIPVHHTAGDRIDPLACIEIIFEKITISKEN